MTLTQVWGALLIFTLCPLLGGMPLTGWITRLVAGINLAEMGTGNVGVSAAFFHGGRVAGVLSVLAEAAKGIGAVLLARYFFPQEPVWEVIALIALVMGRYWLGSGAGTTNVVWGFVVHDPITAGLTFLLSLVGFTIFRNKRQGRLLSLVLLSLLTALRHTNDGPRILAVVCLSGLIAWIYQKIPDDLDLSEEQGRMESRRMFRFFRGDKALINLDRPIDAEKVGAKAATLAQMRAWGYPVPRGYVLPAGDDPAPLIEITEPSAAEPVVVRSSALDEDTGTSAAAGIYASIVNITHKEQLPSAIQRCFASYNTPAAVRYRQDRQLPSRNMAVIVQQQVGGIYSGVAFSRDPVTRCGDEVLVEALPGAASRVVSGQYTPERYQVLVQRDDLPSLGELDKHGWQLPQALELPVAGEGTVPNRLIQQVAYLARQLEIRFQGVPQDIEWTYDNDQLWLVQCRPITTLQPVWTRKIAAEVIPGAIRPLTWSINRPLTCGVWGEIFSVVLGKRAADLDFEATATLHRSYAYFNATLLGEIFLRMGLPPESLEFLTRGAKFSRPPLGSTLRNVPGLMRLLRRELSLEADFSRDDQSLFEPGLKTLQRINPDDLSDVEIVERIEDTLALLKRATYYNILAPLSVAIRRALFRVPEASLDGRRNPEVAALVELRTLAQDTRNLLSVEELKGISNPASLMATLAEHTDGETVLRQLQEFMQRYGYLSEVGTDIAVPTWRENPRPVRELLARFVLTPPSDNGSPETKINGEGGNSSVQQRLDLKGQVNERYSRLLAELRWTCLSLERRWIQAGLLVVPGDIFFLTYEEVWSLSMRPGSLGDICDRIQSRKQEYEANRQLERVPALAYGTPTEAAWRPPASYPIAQEIKGIGASFGVVEGPVKVMRTLASLDGEGVILVVPYTDSGWAPLLAQAKGLVTEVGGRLSHGAIVAREYGIPAVMDIEGATSRLHDGQWVRLDGEKGTVEVLDKET